MSHTEPEQTLIKTKDAAAILGVSQATVRNWAKTGVLAFSDTGKKGFVRAEVQKLGRKIAAGKIARLNRRANKRGSGNRFIPTEYLSLPASKGYLRPILDYVRTRRIPFGTVLFIAALRVLEEKDELTGLSAEQLREGSYRICRNCVRKEIDAWRSCVNVLSKEGLYDFLLQCPLPEERDVLGVLYQSFRPEGVKSCEGAYYTPQEIVQEMVREHVQPFHTVLDPCCGTGQFLLEYAEIVDDPRRIYGFDIDETAVRIARLNVLLRFPAQEFEPNVIVRNTLFDPRKDVCASFDVIASNPPWGYHFTASELKRLTRLYASEETTESFSLFLKVSLELLKEGGVLSFILPESFLNVQSHRTIRMRILKQARIISVTCLGAVFKRIFSRVVRLDLENRKVPADYKVPVNFPDGKKYNCEADDWNTGPDCIFNVHCEERASSILRKIHAPAHTTLCDQADWALGIVTGNNQEALSVSPEEGTLPVWKGKDIHRFGMGKPSAFLRYEPEKCQQVAPLARYQAPEKLIYRFISKRLVFAYDEHQRFTLNSANVLVPRVPGYPAKLILALFNSSLYQFVYQKRFSSMKVLRGQLESLPLPHMDAATRQALLCETDRILEEKPEGIEKLDALVFSLFPLEQNEVDYVLRNIE